MSSEEPQPENRSQNGQTLPLARRLASRKVRPILLGATALLIIMQIVALSPSSLEESKAVAPSVLEPESLIKGEKGEVTLATGIPKDRIPEYTVEQFDYVSTRDGEKQWKLLAQKAFLYNREKLMHARRVKAFLYDPEGKITVVTGKESKYFMNKRDLEVFGDVDVTFPDGFHLKTDYLQYFPTTKKINIPISYAVEGDGEESNGQKIHFTSQGLDWAMGPSAKIVLREAVKFTVDNSGPAPSPSASPGLTPAVAQGAVARSENKDGPTTIISDHCEIYRSKQLAHFTMNPHRALKKRFVKITQPNLYAQSRRADMNYGDFAKMLQYMTAFEDVLIRETGGQSTLQYATGGRADFDGKRNLIVLSEFPQVYQDNDTVTGDIILLHRDTDIVEVEHSNAFSQGR